MASSLRPLLVAASIAVAMLPSSGAAADGAPIAADLAPLLAQADAAYAERDLPGQLDASRAALDEGARVAPEDYGVLWRLARHAAWLAEDPALGNSRKSALGKEAWQLGERAIRADPTRVEGWFYAVAGMGNYALGIGIFTALTQGVEGKFKDRLSHAERIDPGFLGGAIQVAWGRFWFKLPWPKHDARKSERALREALGRNPDDVRAWVYLGDLLSDEGKREEAAAAWRRALESPPGRYDAPEERRWQGVARASLERLARK
jgi:tetratricopeptide (TPR) repeat protein